VNTNGRLTGTDASGSGIASMMHSQYDKVCAQARRTGMADIERLTITLPSDTAAIVKDAVAGGDYASASEVVRDALHDWKVKRALQRQELAAPKIDIDTGLAGLAAGRVKDFDAERIIGLGRMLLASRLSST
jgi:antitoxin ParD1/3/4